MPQGRLRVYLGVAPGAGATHSLLDEARRRHDRGVDVVIGVLDDRGRPPLLALAEGLERSDGPRLDTAALLRRRPATVLVDNLADPADPADPSSPPRWAEAERLVAAGIDVVGTVDVRVVESLRERVEALTGQPVPHTVPDRFLVGADQLQVVDISPQGLRRRLAHGGLYGPDEIDAVRSAGLRPRTLGGLRELALRWVLATVPGQHEAWAREVGDDEPVPAVTERLLVGLSGGPDTAAVLHRAFALAGATPSADVLAVHVLAQPSAGRTDVQDLRERAEAVGARFQPVVGTDVAAALLDVARAERATQVVVGVTHRGTRVRTGLLARWTRHADIAADVVALADPGLDVHVVGTRDADPSSTMPARRRGLSPWRVGVGFVLALALPALLTVALLRAGTHVGLPGDALVLLLGAVITSLVGGLWPAVVGALVGSTMLNYFFIPPVRTLRVAESHNVITIVVFVVVALLVSAVVHRAAATAAEAARATAESRTLSAVASSALHGEEALPALLDQLCAAFGMRTAALLERVDDHGRWRVVAARGAEPPTLPSEADAQVPAGTGRVLALSGRTLAAADRRVLQAFADRAQGLIEREALARSAAVAERLAATERLRDALLAAVGHDLRTPLASATAAVSSLRGHDVSWTDEERAELLATAEESLDRLARLVSDLLDLSRLRAGALTVRREPVWLDEIIPAALDELGDAGRGVGLRVPLELPPALADPALLTRILVNVVGNALRYATAGGPPLVTASATADRVEVRVIDTGPGIPQADVERVFLAFQRSGDTTNRAGLGLGLALSRGLAEAMGGSVLPEETPGGGLTMVIGLEVASLDESAGSAEPGRREREEEA